MSRPCPTPAGAIARGLLAGVGGTAVMTVWQEAAAKLRSSGDEGGGRAEPQTDEERWAQAPAPAQLGKRIVEGVLQRPIPASKIGLMSNVMHWGYGTGWGAVYGIVQGTRPRRGRAVSSGLAFGAFVWAMSYVQLVPLGLYEPPWKYDATTLALDLSYHLAYGAGLGATYAVLAR
jgi:hypothetical protein